MCATYGTAVTALKESVHMYISHVQLPCGGNKIVHLQDAAERARNMLNWDVLNGVRSLS